MFTVEDGKDSIPKVPGKLIIDVNYSSKNINYIDKLENTQLI